MQTHLYLVRHAHSDYTPDEKSRPLSPKGAKDARKVAVVLSKEGVDRVISSPYKRAIQTVEGISREINPEINQWEGFRERLLSTGPVADFQAAVAKVWEEEHFAFEGGESNQQARARGVKEIKKVLQQYAGERIAIGTHGNILALILSHFDSCYGIEFWRQLEMPDIYCLSFDGLELKNVRRIPLGAKAI
ncbi:histidine phosphatase family protein [Planococcus liqunii]|uniref:Histidine phosphatase family protein n=1 Tax=Planococcus liqunii TaxID=3058394 RepID=A0ABT8MVH8_9BACL|nr:MULTISPECIES: histidine phosphatase family protein [unclassified Planococcus (in: firmicutes)]MCP2036697.1 2,3-bisphosphoglycerate-dependent phosphoglycerate mutase [Planomicrobium sp. HSC-17F08]MDN7228778.1 histidine phosphatase family protein [Planococcus sp. N064]WKA51213.1 histidine phosphatase family protein [Planococcus sp. N056]